MIFFYNKEPKYLLICHVEGLNIISRASSLNSDTNYICLYRTKIRSDLYRFKENEHRDVKKQGTKLCSKVSPISIYNCAFYRDTRYNY